KMILGALRSALSAKFAEQKLTVVDGWKLESHKTKAFRQTLGKLNGETNSFLLVESGANVNLERASRNIEGVTLVPPTGLEPYDLLRHEHVMLSREAVAKLSRALSATRPETPVQIEPATPAKKASAERDAETKAPAKSAKADAAQKAPKKPAAKKEQKSKAKPKAKKD
ncbi:MAG TPA: uL4 family ribosomal protein, partial [Candidatus Acidoferrales bacterium]|nr:uL4 family ribosomal protein [Candidatus Acidoferrales bacterium]